MVLPWLDQRPGDPPENIAGSQLVWEELDSWLTPPEKFHYVAHYGVPTSGLDAGSWHVGVSGLVADPLSLTLADLQARPRREVDFTLECSGNHGFPVVTGLIGNARWAGTPLAPVLEEARLLKDAIEVVFYGIDGGMQTIRDNTGIVSAGQTGTIPPEGGGLTITEQFARSMSLDDALDPRNLLCYEMNGEPLPHKNGFPVRLIAPGWYGVANVKWLTRIEVRDQRHAGNFMARDYVTIREEHRGSSDPFWTFSTVTALPAQVGSGEGRTSGQPLRRSWRGMGRADRGRAGSYRRRTVDAGEALRAGGTRAALAWPGVAILDVQLGNACRRRASSHITGLRHRRQHTAGAERSLPRQQGDLLGEQRTHHAPGSHSLIATTVAIGRSEAAGDACPGGNGCGCCARHGRPRRRRLSETTQDRADGQCQPRVVVSFHGTRHPPSSSHRDWKAM